jgi:hypothetical protein
MGGILPDRARFLDRKETLSALVMQVNPIERLAFESAVYPILKHITYCESHELYFLDNKHLEMYSDFAVYIFCRGDGSPAAVFRQGRGDAGVRRKRGGIMNANIITTPRPCSVTIANTKGGTAKTTTALNLATELSKLRFSVLLIDLDPQGSLSKAMLGERELAQYQGIEDLLGNSKLHPAEYITPTKVSNVSILPCHSELNEVAVKLLMNASFFGLKDLV